MYYVMDVPMPEETVTHVLRVVGEHQVVTFPDRESNTGPEREAYLAWLAEGNTPEPWPPAE